jgi:nitric oxide reductase subunit B
MMSMKNVSDNSLLNGGQNLAVKYFIVAIVLFGAQILFGLLAGWQYLNPNIFYGILDFNVSLSIRSLGLDWVI